MPAHEPLDSTKGPYLIIAAMWHETDDTDAVVALLRGFSTPAGYSRGAVVAFRHEVADSLRFRVALAKFDLSELNARPPADAPTGARARDDEA